MLKEKIGLDAAAGIKAAMRNGLVEEMVLGRAHVKAVSRRPKNWVIDAKTGLLVPEVRLIPHKLAGPSVMVPDPDCFDLILEDEAWNLITNAGRDFLHQQGYQTTGLGTNGLNYIALSNDALTETAASTTLSTEITLNGLGRAQGTVAHTAGTNTTTVDHTFTATGAQSAQKAALFTAASVGTMNHVLAFTQRSLISGDTLQITYTITLG